MKMMELKPKFLLLPLLSFLFIGGSVFPAATSLASDAGILIRVKATQLDDPDQRLRDWTPSSIYNHGYCKWSGIACDSVNHTIVSIDFTSFNISGGFPANLCRIKSLRHLNLMDNSFNGSISSKSLSLCSRLRYLNLSANYLVGELPGFTPEFSRLETLDLSNNNFTGVIPASFGRLPALKVLKLIQNLLNGTIPSFLTNLTELTRLELGYNPFKPGPIPSSIGNLTKLEILFLPVSNLIGPIPESIGKLTSLTTLDLSINFLTGKIPDTIGGLRSIKMTILYLNSLSGELPESLGNLTTLSSFDASQNALTGKLPTGLAGLALEALGVNDNFMEGELPNSLALNPNLKVLKLFNNSFSGELPRGLGRLSGVEDFDVSSNRFTGELPDDLCYNKKLQTLILFGNRLSGKLPDSYGGCSTLTRVRISDNVLSGEVPTGFWGNKDFLEMGNNRFEGIMHSSVAGSKMLTQLIVSGNAFSGEFPPELCGLRDLQVLDMSANKFSGPVPPCITHLTMLQKLDLQGNVFSGELPSEVSPWKYLTELNLANNRFSGNIPAKLGDLPVLTYLDLSRNLFSGEIPAALAKLHLNQFNISDNKLEGEVPISLKLYLSGLTGNPGLCSPNLYPLPPCTKSKPAAFLLVVIILSAFAFILIVSFLCILRKKYMVYGSKSKRTWNVMSFQRVGFNENDILSSLMDANLIGTGGSGRVYRVELKTGQVVAVKKFWGGMSKSEIESVFSSEADTLGRIRHRNVVKLMFSCSKDDCRILVFEYMENGSLGDVLHGDKSRAALLDWPRRFEIAVGAAQGLAYLHHDCVPAIIHRDVKSNNILLDGEFYPHVADFGLAKSLQCDVETGGGDVMSRIAGSYGYIAPEYGYTLKVTEKCDVYSYGVVLMELVTGKRPNDPSFGENKDIVKYVTESALVSSSPEKDSSVRKEGLSKVIDAKMESFSCDYKEIEMVLNIALLCTSAFPLNRPSMRRVVELLTDRKFARPNLEDC